MEGVSEKRVITNQSGTINEYSPETERLSLSDDLSLFLSHKRRHSLIYLREPFSIKTTFLSVFCHNINEKELDIMV